MEINLSVVEGTNHVSVQNLHMIHSIKKKHSRLSFCKICFQQFVPWAQGSVILLNHVTLSRKAILQEPRKEIFAKWSRAWLPHGGNGVHVALVGSTVAVTGYCNTQIDPGTAKGWPRPTSFCANRLTKLLQFM